MEQSKTAVVKSCGTLKDQPQLADFQKYVTALEEERGFATQTTIDKCLLLGEEVGELFKAVRKSEGLLVDSNSDFSEIADELADIFIYLCAIANRKGIDLEAAFRSKEEKNKLRKWVRV
ncbi:NTP pyrophosphatase, house-cleaning of non-canonical NTPs [Draconibacterium orientale]|uniref:NTP pyrophosphatase, house-cleaning of non-canonical NTPs n=1 Tax=Draconibacterium orientale TaxID=1168034 RepID=X5DEA8_9BACT|nr:MazG nucleotide pyrophosphohydrolase domain-containing protein [Draconibacterium orientale]AHW59329.1 hypothetical protein FH5T_06185 [Draconibacterium orientale]SET83594.1 NTP pyrophosphatase, house-cleaning of non-canonical NTPs [Draconibacterium orientale]